MKTEREKPKAKIKEPNLRKPDGDVDPRRSIPERDPQHDKTPREAPTDPDTERSGRMDLDSLSFSN